MKALSYNTTNGVVAYSGTNKLTFTNEVRFGGGDLRIDSTGGIYWSGDVRYEPETQTFYEQIQFDSPATAATTRTNLGIPLAALTNNNVTNFRTAILAARAPVWAYKSTNQTNASTNLVSDSALTFTASANTKYAVELFLVAKSSVAALQGKINSTNATSFGFWVEYDAASQFAWLAGNRVTNRADLVSFDGNDVSVWQRFVIVVPTNNATVTFQFAPADTNGSAVIEAGSYLKAEVIE
jgi:hypothetical protein